MSKATFTKVVLVAGGFAATGFATAQAAEVDNTAPEVNVAQEYAQPEVQVDAPPAEQATVAEPEAQSEQTPAVADPATPAPEVETPAPAEETTAPADTPAPAQDPAPIITPAEPTGPAQPTEPVVDEPAQPVEPTDPAAPIDPVNPANPADPVEPVAPTQPEEPPVVEPVEPTEPPHFVEENPTVEAGNGQQIALDRFGETIKEVNVKLTDAQDALVQIRDEHGNYHDAYVQSVNPDGTVNFIINTEGMTTGAYTLHVSGEGFEEITTALMVKDAAAPVKPIDPTQPNEPTGPTDPVTPDEPTNPLDPAQPTDPTQPSEPTEPEQPTKPTEPVTPAQPENPAEPTTPVEPSNPEQPGIPTIPADPEEPAEPTNPATPSDPETPATSETSAEPNAPTELTPATSTPEVTIAPEENNNGGLVINTADQVRPMSDPANVPQAPVQEAPQEKPQAVSRDIPRTAPEDEPTPDVNGLNAAAPMAPERKLESREFGNSLDALLPFHRDDNKQGNDSAEFGQSLQAGALPQRGQNNNESFERVSKDLQAQSVLTRPQPSQSADTSDNQEASAAESTSENDSFNWTPVLSGVMVLAAIAAGVALWTRRREGQEQ